MATPTVILADLHLTRSPRPHVDRELARVVTSHPGARILFAGDLFDLSADQPCAPRTQSVRDALEAHPSTRAALAEHVDRGGELWLIAGNHDAHLADPNVGDAFIGALDARGEARAGIRITPWFFRLGGMHVEHGHLYDPDNAPAHPLVLGERSLGVFFVEELIATTGAYAFLNANDGTPLELFVSAFRWYGPRAPYVVARYFRTALEAMARSGPLRRDGDEPALGKSREADYARETGVKVALLEEMLAAAAEPTMHSWSGTFHRMYFDRVLSTLALLGGGAAVLAGRRPLGLAAGFAGAVTLGASWVARYDRYRGTVAERLASAARQVATITSADLVVFGHAHREHLEERYANTGSFAFPDTDRGRPYLVAEEHDPRPVVRRCYAATSSRCPPQRGP